MIHVIVYAIILMKEVYNVLENYYTHVHNLKCKYFIVDNNNNIYKY